MQGPAQASTSMNPPDGSTTRAVIRSGMDAGLYNAAVEGLEELIERYRDSLSSKVTATGNTVLHLHVGIPVSKGGIPKIQFIQAVLVHCPSLLLKKNENEEIPLHLAARFGHADAAKVFIDQATGMGAGFLREMLMTKDKRKDTALHHAAHWNYHPIVDLLLSADQNCRYARNDDDETPLYIAAERGYDQIVDSLVRADRHHCRDARNDDGHEISLYIADDELSHHNAVATISETCYEGPLGRTALHAAVLSGKVGMLHAILKYNNLLLYSKDREGQTPLHYAARPETEGAHVQILTALLRYDNASQSAVYIQDNKGRTALHLAVRYGSVELIKSLIEHRPDCTELKDDKGRTLFHYAAKSRCPYTIRSLLRNGIVSKLVNEKDHEGKTPLHLLANSLSYYDPIYTFELIKAFREDKEVDAGAFDSQNQTARDIILSQLNSCDYRVHELFDMFFDLRLPSNLRTPHEERPDESPDISRLNRFALEEKDKMLNHKKVCEDHLVVAALIATVSFAAGIAVPGGFDEAHGNALLATKNTAFRVFVVSDTLALTLSAVAILFHSTIGTLAEARYVRFLYILSVAAVTLSLGAMMAAFMAGTFAILYQSPFLLAIISAFTTIYFVSYAAHLLSYLAAIGYPFSIITRILPSSSKRWRFYTVLVVLFLCGIPICFLSYLRFHLWPFSWLTSH